MAGHPPSGTVTFLLTDLEGSTRIACARALAEDRPDVSGVLRGAAYAAFGRATPTAANTGRLGTASVTPEANFILAALREAGDVIDAALGEECRRELRTVGAAMTMDVAVSYALANIDPKLLTGPTASIDR